MSKPSLNDLKDEVQVKSWQIPLPDFHFDHQPYNHSHDHRDFFGREQETKAFLKMLHNSRMDSGSYLVTGYRGAGKTSFVKKVMDDFSNGVGDLANYPTYLRLIEQAVLQKAYLSLHQLSQKLQLPRIINALSHISAFIYLSLIFLLVYFFPYFGAGIDFVLALFIIMLFKFRQHGWSALYPLQWLHWLFKPVVQVHINLGHNIEDQRSVIFGLVNLLKEEYSAQVNRTWLHKLVMFGFILFFAVLFTSASFNVLNHAHDFLEARVHSFIFHDPHPNKPDKPKLENETKVLNSMLEKFGIQLPHNPPTANTTDHAADNADNTEHSMTKTDHHANAVFKVDGAMLEKSCFPNLNYAHNLPDIHVEKYYLLGQQLANVYRESEEVSLFREVFLKTPYCVLYQSSHDLYSFAHKDSTARSNFIQHIAGLLAILYAPYDYFEQVDDAYAPRPYYILHFFVMLLLVLWLRRRIGGPNQILWRLENLCDRIEVTEVLDSDNQIPIPFFSRKRHLQRQRLDERQTESLLLQILQDNATRNWFIKPRVVFIFDELDKIHPKRKDDEPASSVELDFSESVRQRKYEVERLLGSFKNLISVAPCYFIFIAGREMMDANLADQSEIRFLYASLFDKVFYIPSFLTDESDENGNDITSMVEQYVCRRLMRPNDALWAYDKWLFVEAKKKRLTAQNLRVPGYGAWSLPVYNQYLSEKGEDPVQRERLMFFLQDFIYFLTYRSAGDAKKLDLQFEEFVRPKHSLSRSEIGQALLHPALKVYQEGSQDFILFFDKKSQYRVQLIAHLFTIFHGTYSRMIRQYGDKLSVSVFSILDYVCKFHSMAFSKRDFERMADALDVHRAPTLPQVVDMVMNHILSPYTRQIQNGFYSFRFVRYIQREIRYISQFSESDMSAFNFSLDESNQIKAHFQQMLTVQTEHFHQHKNPPDDNYVLPNLHMLIGSLHDQDNDYEPAAIAYRTTIEYLRPTIDRCLGAEKPQESVCSPVIKSHLSALILYVRANLKLGLLQERRMIYDTSHALYNRICDVIKRIFVDAQQLQYIDDPEQILTLCQPAICSAFLHAKTDPDSDVACEILLTAIKTLEPMKDKGAITKSYYSLHVRLADMYILRSEFTVAQAIYAGLLRQYQDDKTTQDNDILTAKIYDGLATTQMAEVLYELYEHDTNVVEPLNTAINNYQNAAAKYAHTGLGSEQQTVLWKLSYALVMGTMHKDDFAYSEQIKALFQSKNNLNYQLHDIAGRIFADAHTIHKQRLSSIGIQNTGLKDMATAPLLHSQTLLQAYINAMMNESAEIDIHLQNLGAFPMHSRVLGLYLKGMFYYRRYQKTQDLELLYLAFYLLIQTLEESLDYECGMDLLIPPLGITRYYIYLIVNSFTDPNALRQYFEQEAYFNADRQRYFNPDYCRRKAQVQLFELLSRHRAGAVAYRQYNDYVRNRFYLYDAFSDPYSQGLWAVEYALVPFAQQALNTLQQHFE